LQDTMSHHRYTIPNRDWKRRHAPEIGMFECGCIFHILYSITIYLALNGML